MRWLSKFTTINRARKAVEGYLASGSTPERLALAVAIGVTGGLFPIFGTTTAVSALGGIIFRVNPVVVQVFNYLMYPIYFPCVFGFLIAGAALFGKGAERYSLDNLQATFTAGWETTMIHFGVDLIYAVLAWVALSPFIVLLVRIATLRLINRWNRRLDEIQRSSRAE